jgi:hypothetical protein
MKDGRSLFFADPLSESMLPGQVADTGRGGNLPLAQEFSPFAELQRTFIAKSFSHRDSAIYHKNNDARTLSPLDP